MFRHLIIKVDRLLVLLRPCRFSGTMTSRSINPRISRTHTMVSSNLLMDLTNSRRCIKLITDTCYQVVSTLPQVICPGLDHNEIWVQTSLPSTPQVLDLPRLAIAFPRLLY